LFILSNLLLQLQVAEEKIVDRIDKMNRMREVGRGSTSD
jgi:hypothetical protein